MKQVFNVLNVLDLCLQLPSNSFFFLQKFWLLTDPTASKYATDRPDKPPLGRAVRPLATLSRVCVRNCPSPSSISKNDTCDEATVTGNDGATDEQVII